MTKSPSPLEIPSDEALAWAARSFGPRAEVTSVRRFTGGITSAMHALSVVDAQGRHRRCVLRRWLGEHERSNSVLRESQILQRLESTSIPAPRLINVDPRGEECGDPALLMSYLDGHIEMTPRDPDDWLRQMATMLAHIHQHDVDAPAFKSWLDVDNLKVPEWTRRADLWQEAFSLMEVRPPPTTPCFIHRDYQQFNLLWRRGKLTGVVDWVWGSSGPPSVDVSHIRLNLSVIYSSEFAQRFLELYEVISGREVERWWDVEGLLIYLPGWGGFLQQQAGRRLLVDYTGMHQRVEETLEAALRRLA